MTKCKTKRRWIFPVALLAYALVFLCAAAIGFDFLWDYMDAYEQSRPHIALHAYEEKLTAQYVADKCTDLIGQIDHKVQSEENCRQVILDALKGNFSFAKKSSESDEDHHVYVIRCGAKVIGTMEMERKGESMQGFIPWQVTKDSFDLSFLLTDPVSITVPEGFTVTVFGNTLDSSYITKSDIPFSLLKEFYDEYDLPHMVTYSAGPFLGEATLTPLDTNGNAVAITEETDMNTFLNNCSAEENDALTDVVQNFVQCYMDFTSCKNNSTSTNYQELAKFMVSGGELAKRMRDAFDGLSWVSDRHATLDKVEIGHFANIGNGRYLCDVTYTVNTRTFNGDVKTTANVKLVFLQTENGLKAEAMVSF